jgi:hypothetical protein
MEFSSNPLLLSSVTKSVECHVVMVGSSFSNIFPLLLVIITVIFTVVPSFGRIEIMPTGYLVESESSLTYCQGPEYVKNIPGFIGCKHSTHFSKQKAQIVYYVQLTLDVYEKYFD